VTRANPSTMSPCFHVRNVAITISPAEVAHAYEATGRSLKDTAAALCISTSTVSRRLADHYGGVLKVPSPPLRSSSAAIGRAFEHRVRDALIAAGWWVVRAAGSKGEADLVALRRRVDYGAPRVVLVSVKRRTAPGPSEWNELLWLADEVSARAVVAFMPRTGGVEYMRITGLKDGRRRPQPWEPWDPEGRA
jgi:Holliday junction resolvase